MHFHACRDIVKRNGKFFIMAQILHNDPTILQGTDQQRVSPSLGPWRKGKARCVHCADRSLETLDEALWPRLMRKSEPVWCKWLRNEHSVQLYKQIAFIFFCQHFTANSLTPTFDKRELGERHLQEGLYTFNRSGKYSRTLHHWQQKTET